MATVFTDKTFDDQVTNGSGVAFVDFFAPWCGPCQMIAPVIDEVAKEFEGKAVVGKVDVDQTPDVANKFGVMSIPTLIVFKDGKEVDKMVGAVSKDQIVAAINKHL